MTKGRKETVTVRVVLDVGNSKGTREELAEELAFALESWRKTPLFLLGDEEEVFVDKATPC